MSARNDTKITAVLRVAAAFSAAQFGGIFLAWLLRGFASGYVYNLLLNVVAVLLVNAAAYLIFCGRIRLPERRENYSHAEPFAFFFAALLTACVAALVSNALIGEGTGGASSGAAKPHELVLYIIYTAVLAPAAEEAAFRGAALSRLTDVFGENGAAVISALFFAAYHMDIEAFAYTFALGFFLAVLAQRSGSVLPCILAHAANNLLTAGVAYSDVLSAAVNICTPVLGIASISWLILTGRLFGAARKRG
ncbi:MAG: lysostaphin resistance A-like protein [Oscillospiraceae bacterium]